VDTDNVPLLFVDAVTVLVVVGYVIVPDVSSNVTVHAPLAVVTAYVAVAAA
jgi:hypothetical protein